MIEEIETTAMGDSIAHYSDKKTAPTQGVAKRKMPFMPGQGPGYELAMLLQKAAGLEGFRLKSIECSISIKQCVTFKAEILGDESDVAAALKANEE